VTAIFSPQKDRDVNRLRREIAKAIANLERRANLLALTVSNLEAGDNSIYIMASDHGIVPGMANASAAITSFLAAVAAGVHGTRRSVYIGPGTYTIDTVVTQPVGVQVRGAGPLTVFIQPQAGINNVWTFASGFTRSGLSHCLIQGGTADPNDFTDRDGVGIDLAEVQQVTIEHVQIWDFQTGIRASDGTPFSAYHTVGPKVEINRCTTGFYAPDEMNVTRFFDSRVFYSYGASDEGVGVDCDEVGGFIIANVAIEACDICLRVRSSGVGLMQLSCEANYYEPGTNPTTLTAGRCYDVDFTNQNDGIEVFNDVASVISGNNGDIVAPPEGFVRADGYSRAFFGARYDGAAVPKRNLVFNGELDMWALPDILPGWVGGGALPTLAINAVDFVTGVRSMDVTATAAGSSVAAVFEVSDPSVEWVTCGVRYRVAAGNVGFFFTGAVGGNLRQLNDADDADEWRVRWVQVPVDPANRSGFVSIVPDSVGGVGAVRIDQVFVVPGRFAVPGTQYGERVKLLPSPIPLIRGTTAANLTWAIDLANLPAVLAPPMDTFSAMPLGVVGAILRLRIEVDDGVGTGALAFPFYNYVDIPATGAVTIAADIQRVVPTFSTLAEETTVVVRDVAITGGVIVGTPYTTDHGVDLVGWVLG
jgi:hypothetical protein